MSQRELDRVGVIRQVVEKGLRQKDADRLLGLSVRQIKRLVRRYRSEGPNPACGLSLGLLLGLWESRRSG